MIILDTNVASVPFHPNPDRAVMAWLDRQIQSSLFITSITALEMFAGVEKLPDGRKREKLGRVIANLFDVQFAARVLGFDLLAAKTYGIVHETLRRKGHKGKPQDAMIAAIAQTHGFTVATRDVEPFLLAGIEIVNPWDT